MRREWEIRVEEMECQVYGPSTDGHPVKVYELFQGDIFLSRADAEKVRDAMNAIEDSLISQVRHTECMDALAILDKAMTPFCKNAWDALKK